jgi:serine acetyltransferase
VVDLTDADGSQVGAVSVVVEKIPPSGTRDFEIPIRQRNAAAATVREVTLR